MLGANVIAAGKIILIVVMLATVNPAAGVASAATSRPHTLDSSCDQLDAPPPRRVPEGLQTRDSRMYAFPGGFNCTGAYPRVCAYLWHGFVYSIWGMQGTVVSSWCKDLPPHVGSWSSVMGKCEPGYYYTSVIAFDSSGGRAGSANSPYVDGGCAPS